MSNTSSDVGDCTKRHKPRIALFIPCLAGGGAERVTVTLANELGERDLDVVLVLANGSGVYSSELSPRVRTVDLRARGVASALPRLITFLRRERPAALLSSLNHASVIACLARRLALVGSRLVIVQHSVLPPLGPGHGIRVRMVRWLSKRVYQWADEIVAVSQGVADDLVGVLGLPRDRVTVVHNPVLTGDLLAKASEPCDHPWFLPELPPVIMSAGRLATEKDFGLLVRAFAHVRATKPARLIILGEGPLRNELEKLVRELGVRDDVSMPGFVLNPYAYMSRAAVFVLSSRREGLPTVLVEALACGTSVVSTDCVTGPRVILQNGRLGLLVPVGDEDALARAILRVIAGERAPPVPRKCLAEYEAETATDRYLRVLLPDRVL
jgi:glycosyltransferase involved in cell wall biosynthesis